MRIPFFSTVLLLGGISLAQAQDPGTIRTLTSGDVDSDFVVAPDFKFTDLNGEFANLAGGYGGWRIDKKFLIGGGVYTLTNGSGPNEMTYGGGVFEYFVIQDSLVNVSVRGLVGGGSATVGPNLDGFDRVLDFDFRAAGEQRLHVHGEKPARPLVKRLIERRECFVALAEPDVRQSPAESGHVLRRRALLETGKHSTSVLLSPASRESVGERPQGDAALFGKLDAALELGDGVVVTLGRQTSECQKVVRLCEIWLELQGFPVLCYGLVVLARVIVNRTDVLVNERLRKCG